MKQIFFKTTRESGASLYAVGKYKQIYKIGKSYQFSEKTPAHVFLLKQERDKSMSSYCWNYHIPNSVDNVPPEQILDDHDLIYKNRAEKTTGNRVLICYGELSPRRVPVCNIAFNWDFRYAIEKWRWTSTDFIVIGEIIPKYKDKENGRNDSDLLKINSDIE